MIQDIELRFVERSVPTPEFGEHICKLVRVLQWRKLIEYREFDEWTEWQDVPLEPTP